MTLKELRISADLTQAQVAKKLDVDQSAVCQWETGKFKPSKKYHKKLAWLYGCSVEIILQAIKNGKRI